MTSVNRLLPSGQRLLAMDTATGRLAVALVEDGRVVCSTELEAERNHSVYLLQAVSDLVCQAGWTMKDVTGVAAGRGPGSYTGVRIAVTAAKTLAWSLGVPAAGLSTLELLAGSGLAAWVSSEPELASISSVEGQSEAAANAQRFRLTAATTERVWVVPLLNARRGQAFTGWFLRDAACGLDEELFGSAWSRRSEDGIRLVRLWAEELLAALRASSPEAWPEAVLFTGETEAFAEELDWFGAEAQKLGVRSVRLSAGMTGYAAGLLAGARFAEAAADPHGLLPNYTQLPEAEVKLLAACKS